MVENVGKFKGGMAGVAHGNRVLLGVCRTNMDGAVILRVASDTGGGAALPFLFGERADAEDNADG